MSSRHPKVKIEKLARQRAWGTYDGIIRIDPRTRGKARLEVLIHEYLHHLWPDKAEEAVTEAADRLADFLHKQHVRVIEPDGVSLKDLDFDA